MTLKRLALAAILLATPAVAETAKPLATRVSPNTTVQARPDIKLLKAQPLKIQPFVFVVNFPIQPADMTGWTARTSGPTRGGGVFVKGQGRTLLVARGADDYLYAAPIDPLGQGAVASSAWMSLGDKSTSEPACAGYDYAWGDSVFAGQVCTFLGQEGNAVFHFLDDRDGTLHGSWSMDMKGKNAGAAPTLLRKPVAKGGVGGQGHSYEFGVWDGKSALFTRTAGWAIGFNFGNVMGVTEWRKLGMAFPSAPGCAEDLCVSHDGAQASVMVLKGDGSEPMVRAQSPKLTGGMTGKPAMVALPNGRYAVVVRGPGGVVHQIVFDGKANAFSGNWKNEGGYIAQGASPACVAVNTQPVCIIQGGDGRLYSKGLAAPSGL